MEKGSFEGRRKGGAWEVGGSWKEQTEAWREARGKDVWMEDRGSVGGWWEDGTEGRRGARGKEGGGGGSWEGKRLAGGRKQRQKRKEETHQNNEETPRSFLTNARKRAEYHAKGPMGL